MSTKREPVKYHEMIAIYNESLDRWNVTCSPLKNPMVPGGCYMSGSMDRESVKDALILARNVMEAARSWGLADGRAAVKREIRLALGL